jgi:tRNA 2-thiouridine synthesizing protein A
VERVLDVRGLSCPIPYVRARAAVPSLGAGDVLVVLATDREAPLDIGALAADEGLFCAIEADGAGWRITLRR